MPGSPDASHRYIRPTWFTKNVFNRLVSALTRAGLSVWGSRELRVRGRKSGEWRSTPVNVLTHQGRRYLVSPRGETQWVRNLRVAGEGELRVGTRNERFHATELSDGDKPEILREYLRRWKAEVGVFFGGVSARSSDDRLHSIAPNHPVFLVESAARRQSGPPIEKPRVEPIRESVTVRSDPERSFEFFTSQMGKWWPVEAYSRAVSEFAHENVEVTELEFQSRPGGSILEHMSDGRVLPWAEVIVWRPPHRVVLAWRPHSALEPPTEVEVTFTVRELGTFVELEHREWQRLSEEFRATLYEIYARGWPTTLRRFADTLDQDIEL